MGLDEKIASAKESTWLKDLFTDSEWETLRVCSMLSLEIEKARINAGNITRCNYEFERSDDAGGHASPKRAAGQPEVETGNGE